MKTAYFWLTPQGKQLAEQLQAHFGGMVEPKADFAEAVRRAFADCDALVFVMATGIVVRTIAPLVQSKASDPAVLVLDQRGKHVISLLSGHLGGANAMAEQAAAYLGGEAVITTATDVEHVPAFDLFAKENHLTIENLEELKYISGALVAGEPVSLCTAFPVEKNAFPETVQIQPFSETPRHACAVAIADTTESVAAPHVLYLRPKSLVLGVGCKKQIPPAHLEQCFRTFLQEHHLSLSAVEKLATIGLKREEPAILALCEKYRLPLEIVADADIQACAYPFAASAFVQQVTGLPSVSEASAYLASGCGKVLTGKVKYSGVTFAACRKTTSRCIGRSEGNETENLCCRVWTRRTSVYDTAGSGCYDTGRSGRGLHHIRPPAGKAVPRTAILCHSHAERSRPLPCCGGSGIDRKNSSSGFQRRQRYLRHGWGAAGNWQRRCRQMWK